MCDTNWATVSYLITTSSYLITTSQMMKRTVLDKMYNSLALLRKKEGKQ